MTTTETLWSQALDELLLDQDTFGDWIGGHLYHSKVVEDSSNKLSRQLAMGGRLVATPEWTVAELTHVMLVETDPAIVMAARAVLRERYMAHRSESVGALVYAEQDRLDDATAPKRPWLYCDAANERMAQPRDVGCEFDGVAR